MSAPTVQDVADLLGTAPNANQAAQALSVVTNIARAYTRGVGFDSDGAPNDEIAAVIVTATCRLLCNPSQLSAQETMGPFAVEWRAGFTGWTLAERETLNRYRVNAQ